MSIICGYQNKAVPDGVWVERTHTRPDTVTYTPTQCKYVEIYLELHRHKWE